MGVVSVRIDDEAEQYFRKHNISVGEVGRRLLEEEARRLQLRDAQARLARRRLKADRPSADLIREARRAH